MIFQKDIVRPLNILLELGFFTEPDYAKSNYWLNVLLLDEKHFGPAR